MKAPQLDLYYFDSCPYCQRVLRVVDDLNIKVNYKDISSDASCLKHLIEVTGRKTVPCLFINEDPMHESLEIIDWLKKNQENLTKK